MHDHTMIHASHPDVVGVAELPRSALAHMSGWSEVKDPERAGKPTARRAAAAKNTATETAATSNSLPPTTPEATAPTATEES